MRRHRAAFGVTPPSRGREIGSQGASSAPARRWKGRRAARVQGHVFLGQLWVGARWKGGRAASWDTFTFTTTTGRWAPPSFRPAFATTPGAGWRAGLELFTTMPSTPFAVVVARISTTLSSNATAPCGEKSVAVEGNQACVGAISAERVKKLRPACCRSTPGVEPSSSFWASPACRSCSGIPATAHSPVRWRHHKQVGKRGGDANSSLARGRSLKLSIWSNRSARVSSGGSSWAPSR